MNRSAQQNRGLLAMRPVYVIGIGLHPYQRKSEVSHVELGLTAVREALQDASLAWPDVDAAFVGTALLGMAPGRAILRHLGATGLAMTQIENASASGSSAVAQASLAVASGTAEVALALGVDKPPATKLVLPRAPTGIPALPGPSLPVANFALLAETYMQRTGATSEQIARVALKNHRNGAANPAAQRRKVRTLDEVMSDPIAGILTRLQCCPVGEGASAVLLASDTALKRCGLDESRAVQVLASVTRTERVYPDELDNDTELTRETAKVALDHASMNALELDVIEVHDAFSVEELLYLEAIGVCADGAAASALADGEFDIGGRCAVSPSGGLLSMGHPIGPTGVGQVVEITRQLRGEAGARQQPNALRGLAHMVGIGAVCVVHVLESRAAR